MKKNNKGFTLVELMAVIIILLTITLITILTFSKNIEKSNLMAFIDEANTIAKAANNKYFTDKVLEPNRRDDLYNGTKSGKVCYSIKDHLIGPYVQKDKKFNYSGSVEICYGSECSYQYKIWLTNGDHYYLNGKTKFDDKKDVEYNLTSDYFYSCDYDTIGSSIGTNTSAEFDFSNSEKKFTVLKDGRYRIELWGAQGGSKKPYVGGYGGYTQTEVQLSKGQELYINVGGQGQSDCTDNNCPGGYNGGGSGTASSASGGGATSVATKSGLISEINEKYLISVAGGGGGAFNNSSILPGNGGGACSGSANGYKVCDGQYNYGKAADGTSAGGGYRTASDVYPFTSNKGYYGGSGYNKYPNTLYGEMYCYNCDMNANAGLSTIRLNEVSDKPISKYSKLGNGYARITLVDQINQSTNGVLAADFSDYLRLDYIMGNKSIYIDSGYKAKSNSGFELETVFVTANNSDNSVYLFGANSSDNPLNVGLYIYERYGLRIGYYFNDGNGSLVQTNVSSGDNLEKYNIKLNQPNNSFSISGGATYSNEITAAHTADSNQNIYIFANNNNGTASGFSSYILYSFKIYENGTKVREYIPCFSKINGDIGLCELYTKEFHKGVGSGNLVKGPINNV